MIILNVYASVKGLKLLLPEKIFMKGILGGAVFSDVIPILNETLTMLGVK